MSATACSGRSSSASNRCRNSLTVNMIRVLLVGWAWRSAAVVTTRKACASMARVIQRYQEVQVRTWCSSRPVRPLPVWKDSSTFHRHPATRT